MGCWSSVRVMWDGGIPSKVLKPESLEARKRGKVSSQGVPGTDNFHKD